MVNNNNMYNVNKLVSSYKTVINLMRYGIYLATLMYMSDMYYNWENYLTVTRGYQHAAPLPGVTSLTALPNFNKFRLTAQLPSLFHFQHDPVD